MYRLRKKNAANIPSETENATALPAENAGILKNRSGIMPSGLRTSQARNAMPSKTDRTSADTISGSPHPSWLASMSPYVALNRAAVPRNRPGMSSFRATSDTDSRTVRVAVRKATTPTGTFRKNTDCHPRRSTIRPPTVGPRARARPDTPAQSPMARARSCAGNVTVMIDRVPGMRRAAPIPWMTRNATSCPVLWDSPQASDDPLEAGDPRAELFRDRGQGHVDDGVVQHDHGQREAHRQEDDDLLPGVVTLEPEQRHDLSFPVVVPARIRGKEPTVPAVCSRLGPAVEPNRKRHEDRKNRQEPGRRLPQVCDEVLAAWAERPEREVPERVHPDRDGVDLGPGLEPAREGARRDEGRAGEDEREDQGEARRLHRLHALQGQAGEGEHPGERVSHSERSDDREHPLGEPRVELEADQHGYYGHQEHLEGDGGTVGERAP